MSRIQILNLPDELIDGVMHNRFVLVVDEHPNGGSPEDENFPARFDQFARTVGAAGGLVSADRVEIVGRTGDDPDALLEFDHAALAESFATALRFHLESSDASDALRAWYERRRAAGEQPTEVHHHHVTEPRFDGAVIQAAVDQSEKMRPGGGPN